MPDLRVPREETPDGDAGRRRLQHLVVRLLRGDEAALESLMELYWDRLLWYAGGIAESEDAAEDLVQEAFVRLWQHRRALGTRGVAAFLYTTTRNLGLNERRRRRIRARLSIGRILTGSSAPPDPLAEALAGELSAAAARVIRALPARRREVFELARDHGLSYREIAEVMGISRQTVANQMSTALEQIRAALRPHLDEPGQDDVTS